MKKFRKLTIALLAICVFAISVTACGPQKTATQVEAEAVAAIREQNIASIQDYTEREFAAILTQVSYENYAAYKEQGQVLISRTFDNDFGARWKAFVDAHGQCTQAVVDLTMRHHDEYTSRIIMTGEDGAQMALTITYDETSTPVKTTIADYSDDSNQAMSQRLAVAGANTIIGIATVFAVLILLSLIIYCFKFVNAAAPPAKKEKAAAAPKAPVKAPAAKAAAPAKDPMSDPALIAVIAAAIAAAEDKPVEGFVVRSIKRVKTNKWR
jgi:sodium pump decarboxylase gamma subunit